MMKRFLGRLLGFCLIQVAIAYLFFSQESHKLDSKGYLGAFTDKVDLLRQSEGPPRVILAGGSPVAFGVDSCRFKREFGLQPVNIGLHGNLGIDFNLRLIETYVRSGDVVVLFTDLPIGHRLEMTPEIWRRLLRANPDAVRYMGGNWLCLRTFMDEMAVSEIALQMQQRGRELWKKITSNNVKRSRQRLRRTTRKKHVYQRACFNEYGDVTGHHGFPPRTDKVRTQIRNLQAELEQSESAPDADQLQDARKIEKVIARMNRCAKHCQLKGAVIYCAYAPRVQLDSESYDQLLDDAQKEMVSSLNFPLIVTPDDATFPIEFFFDSVGHLNDMGKTRYTRRVLAGLAPQLERISRSTTNARTTRQ